MLLRRGATWWQLALRGSVCRSPLSSRQQRQRSYNRERQKDRRKGRQQKGPAPAWTESVHAHEHRRRPRLLRDGKCVLFCRRGPPEPGPPPRPPTSEARRAGIPLQKSPRPLGARVTFKCWPRFWKFFLIVFSKIMGLK